MFRKALIAIYGFLWIGAAYATTVGGAPWFGPLIVVTLILGGLLFEQHRYTKLTAIRPEQRFEASGEKFIDPETGAPVTVFADPMTGERRYVVDRADQ